MRLDQEEKIEEIEWTTIFSGAFHNPAMAKKLVEEKGLRDKGENVEDKHTEQVIETGKKKIHEDADISEKIRERRSEDNTLLTLRELLKEEEEG